MRKPLFIAVLFAVTVLGHRPTSAQSLSPEALQYVKHSVIELCRGGTIEGKSQAIELAGKGDATVVVLKKLAELGVDGRVEFSQEEWEGIRAIIPDKWDQAAYNECVNSNVKLFIAKLEEDARATTGDIKIYEDESAPVCDGQSYVRVIVYRHSARRAKHEIQLIGADIDTGRTRLRVGESITTSSSCMITLAETGYDRDFYARLKFQRGL